MYLTQPVPYLLLTAPNIAGLLPAQAQSLQDDEHGQQPIFECCGPRLQRLSPTAREQLLTAIEKLLEVAVAFSLGEMNEAALRAAEVIFHRAIAGPSTPRPRNPIEYCAEKDADVLDWYLSQSQRAVSGQEEVRHDVAVLQERTV